MRHFRIHEIRILSRRDRAARMVPFHPTATVLTGGKNDTGKSSIIKTIPWCLGAEPAKKDSTWEGLDVAAALTFSLDGVGYIAVRHRSHIAIFDLDGRVLVVTSQISRVLGPYLAKLLDFELVIPDRQHEAQVPPPAFWLLPFYTDQDKGWKDSWCSFANLGQFRDFKPKLAEYHIGLRTNEYYRLSANVELSRAEAEQLRLEDKALSRAVNQVRSRLSQISVDFDLSRFQGEISELARIAGDLADEEEKYRRKIALLSSETTFYSQHLQIAQGTLKELTKDYSLAKEQPRDVECPTCGATYQNSLVERFGIAFDAHQAQEIVSDIHAKLSLLSDKLKTERGRMTQARARHADVWRLLNTKREAITLHEMLRSEARGQAIHALQSEVDTIRATVAEIDTRLAAMKEELRKLDSKERRDDFLDRFWSKLVAYCSMLRVPPPERSSTFVPSLNQTGSDLPRLVLAYNYAIISMIWESGACARAPIMMDSPHQQDPDPSNRKSVCEFIRAQTPKGAQLILALVDPCGVDYGGSVITLDEERAMLRSSEYETTGKYVADLVERMYNAAITTD